jgi:hypothetical protein
VLLKLKTNNGDFRIIECRDCEFKRCPEPVAILDQGTEVERKFPVVNKAFLMNANGDTLDVFSAFEGRRT